MSKKVQKTNALRILDREKVPYEVTSYEVDESDLSGVHAASVLHMNPDMLFKTLVLHGDKTGYLVACIPVEKNVNLKKVAQISKNKKVEMIPMKNLLEITGYIRGGCSPVGMKKQFPTYIEKTVMNQETIGVSAGQRGLQVLLSPQELIRVTHAKVEEITE